MVLTPDSQSFVFYVQLGIITGLFFYPDQLAHRDINVGELRYSSARFMALLFPKKPLGQIRRLSRMSMEHAVNQRVL